MRERPNHVHPRAARWLAWPAGALFFALLAATPDRAEAGVLGQGDVTLGIYFSSDGSDSSPLAGATLASFFGPHECLCPSTLMVTVELTTTGETNLGTSTLTTNFMLGSNCLAAPAGCVSVGQVSFSATQTATAPTFSSSLVFQTVAGTTTVSCSSLTAGSTTLWAVLTQDATPLGFTPTLDLPVITKTVSPPTAVTAQPASKGLLVTWTPPADTSMVSGYQVLCLPRPDVAATAGYESCGLVSTTGATTLTPTDTTQLCSASVPAKTTSIRLSGLENGIPYTFAVVAIDPGGGVSALSPQATGTPQETKGFYEKYKLDGGAATGCAFVPSPASRRAEILWIVLVVAALLLPLRRRWRRHRTIVHGARLLVLVLAAGGSAQAQVPSYHESDDWAAKPTTSHAFAPPVWGVELGISFYRPAIDSELGNGVHPFADIFSNSRRMMSEAELVRYLDHRFGAWGVGLRAGYYKVTGAAFLADMITRSGDETGLRLIPFALSLVYRATDLPGLRRVPLVPYGKAGLDAVWWTASNTGASSSHHGFSPGWHLAAGLMLGLNFLGSGQIRPGAIAEPCALFFEWDYAAINGLGMTKALHVGDNTWFAGIMFDL